MWIDEKKSYKLKRERIVHNCLMDGWSNKAIKAGKFIQKNLLAIAAAAIGKWVKSQLGYLCMESRVSDFVVRNVLEDVSLILSTWVSWREKLIKFTWKL